MAEHHSTRPVSKLRGSIAIIGRPSLPKDAQKMAFSFMRGRFESILHYVTEERGSEKDRALCIGRDSEKKVRQDQRLDNSLPMKAELDC